MVRQLDSTCSVCHLVSCCHFGFKVWKGNTKGYIPHYLRIFTRPPTPQRILGFWHLATSSTWLSVIPNRFRPPGTFVFCTPREKEGLLFRFHMSVMSHLIFTLCFVLVICLCSRVWSRARTYLRYVLFI